MDEKAFGVISGSLVMISIIPYALRTYQRKIESSLTSWALWTLIGLALLLTYRSSGATWNVWPAIFGFTNPLLITLMLIKQREKWEKTNWLEKGCVMLVALSLTLWVIVRTSPDLSQYALYLAMVADIVAAVPTAILVWADPRKDRPFAWCLFAVGYLVALLAITEHSFANYILPIYQFAVVSIIALPLIVYRCQRKYPWWEWI